MTILITDSLLLKTLPPKNTTVGTFVVLTPASFLSWGDCFTTHPPSAGFQYHLTPGDYRGWGIATIDSGVGGGASGNPAMIRYVGSEENLHPVTRKAFGAGEAVVDSILFTGANSKFWHIHGLTTRAPTGDNDVVSNAHHITWDWMLVEDSTRAYGIRLRSFGSDSHQTVQRCVIRNFIRALGDDSIGVQVFPIGANAIHNTLILDNEIYNVADGVQVSQNASDDFVETSGIIEGNDLYITSAMYGTTVAGVFTPNPSGNHANAENAIDMKSGSYVVPWTIRNNRMWGFRPNGVTSTGDAMVFHIAARNTDVSDNIIGDAPRGLQVSNWNVAPSPLGQDTPRNLRFYRNQWHDIIARSGDTTPGSGAALRPINNEYFEGNYYARCDYLLYTHGALRAGGPTFTGERRVLPNGLYHPESVAPNPYVEGGTNLALANATCESYQRRRWTGIQNAVGAFVAAPPRFISHRNRQTSAPNVGPVSHRNRY